MRLRPIKTKKQYEFLLERIDEQFERKVKADSSEGEQLQIALLLIKKYEGEHYPVPLPDPIEAIKIKCRRKD